MMKGTSACSFRGKYCRLVFSNFSNFHNFCQQQKTHTPARACTRQPAKHGSKSLAWGLDTAEHRLHCYIDHNSQLNPQVRLFVPTAMTSKRAYSTVQYSKVQYSTVQYSTVQYSTVQHSTVHYSAVQYSTAAESRRKERSL